MIYDPEPGAICACGHDAIFRRTVHISYPRVELLPEAMDPWRVHGHRSIQTCGNPECEAGALKACRERVIDEYVLQPAPWLPSGLSAEQMAGLELGIVS